MVDDIDSDYVTWNWVRLVIEVGLSGLASNQINFALTARKSPSHRRTAITSEAVGLR